MSAKTGKILFCVICNAPKYVSGKRLNSFRYCSYKCGGRARKGIILKMAFKKNDPRITGKGNYQWKEKPSYTAVHRWVKKWFGVANYCEHCDKKDKRMYHWANVSGDYLRDRKDWIMLCVSCHSKFDNHGEKSRNTYYKNHPEYL